MTDRTPATIRSIESIIGAMGADMERKAAIIVVGGRRRQHDEEWTSDETLRLLKQLHAEAVDLRKEVQMLKSQFVLLHMGAG